MRFRDARGLRPRCGDWAPGDAAPDCRAGALEKWDDLVRRYQKRRSGGNEVQRLDDDIKVSALESMVPQDLEQHLAMNRSRLTTYQQVRDEIESYKV